MEFEISENPITWLSGKKPGYFANTAFFKVSGAEGIYIYIFNGYIQLYHPVNHQRNTMKYTMDIQWMRFVGEIHVDFAV